MAIGAAWILRLLHSVLDRTCQEVFDRVTRRWGGRGNPDHAINGAHRFVYPIDDIL